MSNRFFKSAECGSVVWRRIAVWAAVTAMCCAAQAATAQDLAGTWQGTLQAGKGQRIVVKISKDGAGWTGLVYNLDADMAYEGRVTTQMSLQGTDLRFAITPIDATYTGKLGDDGASVAGTWMQGGQQRTLNLARATGDAVWEIPRAGAAMAQDVDPDWDVATVRPSDPNGRDTGFNLRGRQILFERQTVEAMLVLGFGLHKKQIVGAPDWITTDRWDVRGIPDVPGQPNLAQYRSLIRKAVVERFGMKMHMEQRELPVYTITVARGGDKMVKSTGDANGQVQENDRDSGGQRLVQMTNASMGDFVLAMKFFADRPVVDQTGLTGRYDIRLKWTFDETQAPTDGSAAPSLFTAIQEQLGLKLGAVKAMADVLVVDKVERPGAN
jgi:uncharacterized protein (TIGR03435 family)